jgi:hypothetical protein
MKKRRDLAAAIPSACMGTRRRCCSHVGHPINLHAGREDRQPACCSKCREHEGESPTAPITAGRAAMPAAVDIW